MKTSNISLKDFKKFLKEQGCIEERTNGGHIIFTRPDLTRPIVIQSHISPVPEFIVKNTLKQLKLR